MPKTIKTSQRSNNSLFLGILILLIILVILIVALVYMYIQTANQKLQLQNAYNSLNSNYSVLGKQYQSRISAIQNKLSSENSSLIALQKRYDTMKNMTTTPFIEELAINKSVTVPKSNFSIPFYNSNYGLYNNYTVTGDYFINFTAPYDGYMLLYLYSSTGKNGTYGFGINSNTSRTFYPTGFRPIQYCLNLYENCAPTIQAISGYELEPNTTYALYVVPVLRGGASFAIQNSNNHAINVTFSLLYVGEYFANTTIDTNYTGSSELPQHFNNSTKELNYSIRTPLRTLYVGQNMTLGNFKIVLVGVNPPNQNNVSSASIDIYYNNVLTNTTQLNPGSYGIFQIGNQKLNVEVNQTFNGLYAYEKFAKFMIILNNSS